MSHTEDDSEPAGKAPAGSKTGSLDRDPVDEMCSFSELFGDDGHFDSEDADCTDEALADALLSARATPSKE